jgi:uncharacterized protein YciI
MFIVNIRYKVPLEEVDRFLEEHKAFLDEYYAKGYFCLSGRKEPRVGGVILCSAKNADEVKTIMKRDPFQHHNLADYELIEFNPTKANKAFQALLAK